MAQFAKIIQASDGHDVLFYLGTDGNDHLCLHRITEDVNGLQADFPVPLKHSKHHKTSDRIIDPTVKDADKVRAAFVALMAAPVRFSPAFASHVFTSMVG
jgi:hypothetical protein